MRLKGRVAVVTGASRGIGKATALELARQGAAVVLNFSRNAELAEQAADDIRRAGGRAITARADVSDEAAVETMMKAAETAFGKIDILINNAGIFREANLQTATDETLAALMAVNVRGLLHCSRAAASRMIERRYGRIVNISSIAAFGTRVGETTLYAATKAAANALTKRLALELGAYGITVNAVCPGPVRTSMYAGGSPAEVEARLAGLAQKAILHQVAEPEDVAHAVVFLSSDEARLITAQALTIDGGRTDFLSHSA